MDFVAEWMEMQLPLAPVDEEYWMMFFDGSLMKRGAELVLFSSLPWAFE